MLRAIFSIGSGRYKRVKASKEKRQPGGENVSSFTTFDIDRFSSFLNSLELEEGFACAHRRMKFYICLDIQTWKQVWRLYEKKMELSGFRVMGYKRFCMYRKSLHPNLALRRVMEDCCDTCVRIETALLDPDVSQEQKLLLAEALTVHHADARAARIVMKEAIAHWGGK